MTAIPDATDQGFTLEVDLSADRSVLVYDDGTYRFRHRCDRGDRGVIICSPALRIGTHGPGHAVVTADPLTISPSILCPDCGDHGFVRDGTWVSA